MTKVECEEMYFVISESGTVHSEKGNFELTQGDAYFFEKREKYWVEGDNMFVSLVNVPKWTPEQHQVVD